MEFKIADKVVLPKRPEWGVGTIQPPLQNDVYKIHFSTAGMKTLRKDMVTLHPWEEGKQAASYKSESQLFRMKEVKSYLPKFFKKEFVYDYPPAYLKSFLQEDLPREWMDKNPHAFDENDWQFISKTARKKHHFYAWMGGVLLARTLEWRSLQPAWAFQNQSVKQAHLKSCFEESVLDTLKTWERKEGLGALPQLVGFDMVYHRKALVWIKELEETFSPAQIAVTKDLVNHHQVDFFIIRLGRKARFDITTAS